MKDKLGFVLGVLLLTTWGCDFAEPPEEREVGVAEDVTEEADELERLTTLSEEVGDGVLIDSETFVDRVKAGDKIFITLRGLRTIPTFSLRDKRGEASWEILPPRGKKQRLELSPVRPEPIRVSGKCIARFRDYVPESKTLFFDGNPWEYPIRFRIGGVTYPLGDVIEKGYEASLIFRVRADMLEGSNELYLVVENGESRDVRVGFIDYGDCKGRKWGGFRSDHNTDFKFVPDGDRHYFFVNWRKEGKQ